MPIFYLKVKVVEYFKHQKKHTNFAFQFVVDLMAFLVPENGMALEGSNVERSVFIYCRTMDCIFKSFTERVRGQLFLVRLM